MHWNGAEHFPQEYMRCCRSMTLSIVEYSIEEIDSEDLWEQPVEPPIDLIGSLVVKSSKLPMSNGSTMESDERMLESDERVLKMRRKDADERRKDVEERREDAERRRDGDGRMPNSTKNSSGNSRENKNMSRISLPEDFQ